MSFALPSVKANEGPLQQFPLQEGVYGVPDAMTNGLNATKPHLEATHPLMTSELNYRKHVDTMNMTVLRNTQGLHAPMRIAMELKSARKVGHLPFLQSSNVMIDSLTGRDLEIDATDVFNTGEFMEVGGNPHAMVERSVGLL